MGPGNRGFLDVLDTQNSIIYDFKFGNATWGPGQYLKYQRNFPGHSLQLIRPEMAENINDIKKKVSEHWQNAFPQLVKYAQNKYYKIVGPLLVGIELIKLPRVEEYRPHFVTYSLWGNKAGKDLKACLSGPIILKEFFNKKGLQFSIPYTNHNTVFPEVLKAVKKQMPITLDGETSIKKVYAAIEEYSQIPPLSAAPNSYLQASLQEYKIDIALCIGADKQAQEVLKQIKKRDWDLNHFAMFGINTEKWIKT